MQPTPGPWRFEVNEKLKTVQLCGGEARHDLIVMDFVRYGMSGAAPRFNKCIQPDTNIMERAEHFAQTVTGREHHASWFKGIGHPDANLIEQAPAILLALQLIAAGHARIERFPHSQSFEFCFGGMRYSVHDFNLSPVFDHIGWAKARAILAGNKDLK